MLRVETCEHDYFKVSIHDTVTHDFVAFCDQFFSFQKPTHDSDEVKEIDLRNIWIV